MNKAKSVFLSILAIAAWAGCSQNNDVIPELQNPNKAKEARVSIKVAGQGEIGVETKSPAGIPGSLAASNSTVNNYTAFAFSASGSMIGSVYSSSSALSTVSTTTEVSKIVVIANAGNLTTGAFAAIKTEADLRNQVMGLLTEAGNADAPLTQYDTNLYMSGESAGAITFTSQAEGPLKGEVTVVLKFVPARIQLKKITFNGGTKPGAVTDNVYVPAEQYNASSTANFTIDRIILINAQTKTRLLESAAGSGLYAPETKTFAGGVAWGTPWNAVTQPNGYEVNNEFLLSGSSTTRGIPAVGDDGKTISDIARWYVFDNPAEGAFDALNPPTAIAVKIRWRKVQGSSTAREDVTSFFTVYFGGGDRESIKAGVNYNVSLALNGNFKPQAEGGSGGGSTDKPGLPTINADVSVTVTAAEWKTSKDIEKSFDDSE